MSLNWLQLPPWNAERCSLTARLNHCDEVPT